MDELPPGHRAIVAALAGTARDELDPVDLALDLGLPLEAIFEMLKDLDDLDAGDRERLLGEPAPRRLAPD